MMNNFIHRLLDRTLNRGVTLIKPAILPDMIPPQGQDALEIFNETIVSDNTILGWKDISESKHNARKTIHEIPPLQPKTTLHSVRASQDTPSMMKKRITRQPYSAKSIREKQTHYKSHVPQKTTPPRSTAKTLSKPEMNKMIPAETTQSTPHTLKKSVREMPLVQPRTTPPSSTYLPKNDHNVVKIMMEKKGETILFGQNESDDKTYTPSDSTVPDKNSFHVDSSKKDMNVKVVVSDDSGTRDEITHDLENANQNYKDEIGNGYEIPKDVYSIPHVSHYAPGRTVDGHKEDSNDNAIKISIGRVEVHGTLTTAGVRGKPRLSMNLSEYLKSRSGEQS